ncbi:MAG: hypothetical protein OXH49_11335 [Gemmatimonadetes bacterium]|nr:hypothetical protein [Gemmatimonadota bacterium]
MEDAGADPAIRLRAAGALLDRGIGRPLPTAAPQGTGSTPASDFIFNAARRMNAAAELMEQGMDEEAAMTAADSAESRPTT